MENKNQIVEFKVTYFRSYRQTRKFYDNLPIGSLVTGMELIYRDLLVYLGNFSFAVIGKERNCKESVEKALNSTEFDEVRVMDLYEVQHYNRVSSYRLDELSLWVTKVKLCSQKRKNI